MLGYFHKWILDQKTYLSSRGLVIEELVLKLDCPLPFVKVIISSEFYMGQICLYENRLMDLEIISSNDLLVANKLDFYEHHELKEDVDWSLALGSFIDFMAQKC